MRTILLALDAIDPSHSAVNFASYLAIESSSGIKAVFLENLDLIKKSVLKDLHNQAILFRSDVDSVANLSYLAEVEDNIKLFKSNCDARGILYDIHRSSDSTGRELTALGRFADFLIIDSSTSFEKQKEAIPGKFIQDLLENASCPVILAPVHFQEIESIIFGFDGSDSSLFAIKQFTYLFPQFNNRKLVILYVHPKGKRMEQEKSELSAWLGDHYNNWHYEEPDGIPRDKLFEYLFKRDNIILIMGAFGRNSISRFFKKSLASPLIKTITQPVFITHI